jgi:hypothetical protein
MTLTIRLRRYLIIVRNQNKGSLPRALLSDSRHNQLSGIRI